MTNRHLIKFPGSGGDGTTGYPPGWTVVSGQPQVKALRHYAAADGHELAGYWSCSPGAFEVVYANWEFCHMLAGRCIITEEGGAPVEFKAGDSFVVEAGFRGRWEVVETMEKHFVFVIEPKA